MKPVVVVTGLNGYKDSLTFLEVLDPNNIHTFQTFDDSPNKRPELAKILHGTLEQHLTTLTRLNKQGAGIYVMVNSGNGKGRTKANVQGVRAIFADFDGVPLPQHWLLEPHISVESSAGKYQIYWLVTDVTLEDFPIFQKALAKHYSSDPSVTDVCRVMRLPGVYHCKAEAVLVKLLETSNHPHYNRSELLEAMPFLQRAIDETREAQKRISQPRGSYLPSEVRLDAYTQTALQNECNKLAMMPPNSGRNVQLNKSAFSLGQLVGAGLLERRTVEEALLNAANDCGLIAEDGEVSVRSTLKSGLDAGIKEPRDLTNLKGFHELGCSVNKNQTGCEKTYFTNKTVSTWGKPSPWGVDRAYGAN